MNEIMEYLPFLIPLLLLNFVLIFIACKDIMKRKKFRFGNAFIWYAIVILVQFFGPALYLTIGKGDE